MSINDKVETNAKECDLISKKRDAHSLVDRDHRCPTP